MSEQAICREQLEQVVVMAAAAVNAALLELVQQQSLTGGTAAVFALVSGSQLLLGHLGDSKAILCHSQTSSLPPAANSHQQHTSTAGHPRQQHKLHTAILTHDHSPDRPDELERITAAGGFVSRATAGDISGGWLWLCNTHGCQQLEYHQQDESADTSAVFFVSANKHATAHHEPWHTELWLSLLDNTIYLLFFLQT